MRVLGVDPGTLRMGYGVLDGDAANVRCLEWGCLAADRGEPLHLRLHRLYLGLEEVVKRWRPAQLAVEEPFVSPTRGAKSGIVVGQATGSFDHREKSRFERPCSTSLTIHHDSGETRAYQGHRVSLE